MRHPGIENAAILLDHRTIALSKDCWFIEHDGQHVVVAVPTVDYKWLDDQGYDPEDFTAGGRPLVYGAFEPSEQDCGRCKGKGQLERGKRWRGLTAPLGEFAAQYPSDAQDGTDIIPCFESRCIGGKRSKWVDWAEPELHPEAEDRLYLPFKLVVWPCKMVDCETCGGKGRHVDPRIDACGLSHEDFDEDPDFEEGYFRGDFDVTCYECKGAKQVSAIDTDRMHPEDLAVYNEWLAWRDEMEADLASDWAERAAEMRAGC
jgi:hypothetical protein